MLDFDNTGTNFKNEKILNNKSRRKKFINKIDFQITKQYPLFS